MFRFGRCTVNRVKGSSSQLRRSSAARKPHSLPCAPVLKTRGFPLPFSCATSFQSSYRSYSTVGVEPETSPEKTAPFSINPSLNSNLKVSDKQDLPVIFTCKSCGARSTKAVCSESHEKGMVVARCDGCGNLHLIVDRLGLLEEEESSLEDYISTRGVEVKKRSVETFNLALKDIAGVGSILSDYPLSKVAPWVQHFIEQEKNLQLRSLQLTASENYTSRAVMEAVGPCVGLTYPVREYYVDKLVSETQEAALKAFNLNSKKWGVNIRPLPVSSANFEVYRAILSPGDRIMGLGFPRGSVSVEGTSVSFESLPYRLDESTGLIDYDNLEKEAASFRPKLIVAGASAYPRDFDYRRMRKISDAVGAFLLTDISHISGLVSASVVADPFKFSDIVTTSTDKSLRGPRGSIIFFKKKTVLGVDLESVLNDSALSSSQEEGPHVATIAGVEVCLNLTETPEFKAYQNKMVSNARALAGRLLELGYKIVSGGTDNHLLLVDLRPLGIDGARVEVVLDRRCICLSRSSVPGDDESASVPGGILIGSSAMTIRGFKEDHFVQVADFIHEGVQIAIEANRAATGGELEEFEKFIKSKEFPLKERLSDLCVFELVTEFPIPGL